MDRTFISGLWFWGEISSHSINVGLFVCSTVHLLSWKYTSLSWGLQPDTSLWQYSSVLDILLCIAPLSGASVRNFSGIESKNYQCFSYSLTSCCTMNHSVYLSCWIIYLMCSNTQCYGPFHRCCEVSVEIFIWLA